MTPTALVKLGDQTITAKDYVFDWSFPKSGGHPNPHLWMNPTYAARYAELVRDALSALDPAHAPSTASARSSIPPGSPRLIAPSPPP